MAKKPVCAKLEASESEALGAFAKEHHLTRSAAGRELIRRGLGMGGEASIKKLIDRLEVIERRTRRAQIAAYRAYAGVIEMIQFMVKDNAAAKQMMENLVKKSQESLEREEARGDYR